MAKLTLANLTTLINNYIVDGKIIIDEATYDITRESLSNLVVKIGKQLMNDSQFSDRLPELEGEELPYGTTIEEYFINLAPAKDHDPDGATDLAPERPDFEDNFYTEQLARKTFKTTLDDNKYEKAMLGEGDVAALTAVILKRLWDSFNIHKYQMKKQLLGRFIDKVPANGANATMKTVLAKPINATTGEAFVKSVKEVKTQLTDFVTETNNLNGVIATSPEVTLYIKGSDILPVIDTDVLAGAFNVGRAEIPVNIKVLEDFGELTTNTKAWAILIDPRGAALHPHRFNATSKHNAEGEFTNYYLHYTGIAYLSPFTNIHIWETE